MSGQEGQKISVWHIQKVTLPLVECAVAGDKHWVYVHLCVCVCVCVCVCLFWALDLFWSVVRYISSLFSCVALLPAEEWSVLHHGGIRKDFWSVGCWHFVEASAIDKTTLRYWPLRWKAHLSLCISECRAAEFVQCKWRNTTGQARRGKTGAYTR